MRSGFIPERRQMIDRVVDVVIATVVVFSAIYAAAMFIGWELRPMSWQAARAALVASTFIAWRWIGGAK